MAAVRFPNRSNPSSTTWDRFVLQRPLKNVGHGSGMVEEDATLPVEKVGKRLNPTGCGLLAASHWNPIILIPRFLSSRDDLREACFSHIEKAKKPILYKC